MPPASPAPRRPARDLGLGLAALLVLALAAARGAPVAAQPAGGSYLEVRVFDAATHRNRKITFTGEVVEVRPTRNNDHARVRVNGAEAPLLVFIPSSTLAGRPELWDLAPGTTYQFWGMGEVFGAENELIIGTDDPSPRALGAGGGAAPFGAAVVAVPAGVDAERRAAADDAAAAEFEAEYERRAAGMTHHAAMVTGELSVQLPHGRRSGAFRLTQQWRAPHAWHIVGAHDGVIPASALAEEDTGTTRIARGDSLLVLGSSGCFGMSRWYEAGAGEEAPAADAPLRSLQLFSPAERWTELLAADPGLEAGWVFLTAGALPIHNMLALFEAGTMRRAGEGEEEGRAVLYVAGRARFVQDYRPGAARPELRLAFDAATFQPVSALVRGALFEVRVRVDQFSANYAQDPGLFAPPVTPAPFVAWQALGRSPLVVGGLRLNLEPFLATGSLQLVSYPGFTLMLK